MSWLKDEHFIVTTNRDNLGSVYMILVIGLGNPILGDDGVGWRVAELVEATIGNQTGVECDFLSIGGLSLMERMIDYPYVILIDTIVTGKYQLGTVLTCRLAELPFNTTSHLNSSHDTSIQDALIMGKSMGANLPEKVYVIAIESQNVYDFSEELSPRVNAAVPEAAQRVIDLVNKIKSKIY